MGRLFHRRLIAGLAALTLFALTAAVTTAMTCMDGRPCEMTLFRPMMAAAPAEHGCCPAPDDGPGISAYGACIYQGGNYTAIVQAPVHPTLTDALLPAAWTPPAPRVLLFESSADAPAPRRGAAKRRRAAAAPLPLMRDPLFI